MPDWDAYHKMSAKDKPHRDIVNLINSLHDQGWHTIALTARPEKWRQLTNSWLICNLVFIDVLIMRPDNNFDKSPDFKLSVLLNGFVPADDNIIILDDREDVALTLQAAGYNTMQVFPRRANDEGRGTVPIRSSPALSGT